MISKGIRCKGKVQGVFFRATTKSTAEQLGLVGWVKNEPDGTVQIHVEGPEDKIHDLIDWCRSGPEYANVEGVESWDENANGFDSFEIRH